MTIRRSLILSALLTSALTVPACSTSNPIEQGPADTAVEAARSPHELARAALPDRDSVAGLAAAVGPSVVNITTRQSAKTSRIPRGMLPLPGFGRPAEPAPRQGAGSGFILDDGGKVVTNAHVVKDADEVVVRLKDDREYEADVVGIDEELDVALLQLREVKSALPAVRLGDSDGLLVGEHVLAVGNPFGLGHTVTMGIVSAKARTIGAGPYDDFIQTDASINPGNSGGPLFNFAGEVVGINTAIRRGADGIGFAIPIEDARHVIAQLAAKGFVERGRLGVRFQPIDGTMAKALGLARPHGAIVAEVEPAGPAAEAGFEEGDVIVEVDGERVRRAASLPRLVAQHAPGSEVPIVVLRQGAERTLRPTLGKLEGTREAEARPAPAEDDAQIRTDWGFSVRQSAEGLQVTAVDEASTGLKAGDLVLEVAGAPVTSVDDLTKVLSSQSGEAVLLQVRRGEQIRFVAIER